MTSCARPAFDQGGVKKNTTPPLWHEHYALQIALEATAEIKELLHCQPSGAIDLESVETAVRSMAMDFAGALVSAWINSDNEDEQVSQVACDCGAVARRAGVRVKRLISALGCLELSRVYYHCEACGSGVYPKDRRLGIEGKSVSGAVERMIGRLAGELSFASTQKLLACLANVQVSVKQAERVAERIGGEIMVHERNYAQVEQSQAQTMNLGIDGTGVPVVKTETEGRRGKHADGGAKTREMKLAVIWTSERTDEQGRPRTDAGSVSYTAAIESASTKDTDKQISAFGQRVEREATRRGFDVAKRQVLIGDGAPWIWALAAELYPDAIEIIDVWHAQEKLYDVGKAIFSSDCELAEAWADKLCSVLDEGKVEQVIEVLSKAGKRCDLAAKSVGYFSRNRERMRYNQFRAQGLCVSSGIVEAGCKDTVGARLKRSGMRWTVEGANSIAALRCYVKSNRYDDFWYDKSMQHMANEKI